MVEKLEVHEIPASAIRLVDDVALSGGGEAEIDQIFFRVQFELNGVPLFPYPMDASLDRTADELRAKGKRILEFMIFSVLDSKSEWGRSPSRFPPAPS